MTWLRSQMASARLLKPIAWSAEAGNRQRPRYRAEREQQLVVAQLLGIALVRAQLYRSRSGVMAGDRPQPQVGAVEDVAQRRDDVTRLKRPRRRLGQERHVEHEVDVVDEDQPRRLLRHRPLQAPRSGGAAETTTGNYDIPSHAPSMPGRERGLLDAHLFNDKLQF